MDQPTPIDGVASSTQENPEDALTKKVANLKKRILYAVIAAYVAVIFWSGVLLAILPDPTGQMQFMKAFGILSLILIAGVFLAGGLFALMRIGASDVSDASRTRSMIIVLIAAVPGVLIAAGVGFLISQEPGLTVRITSPTSAQAFVAPLPVTFSLEEAVAIEQNLGRRPVTFQWDIDGNGTIDEETVAPVLTITFERAGVYSIGAVIIFADGTSKSGGRRIIIQESVFKIVPPQPIVERTAVFSVSNLLEDPTLLKEVQWDFNGDGTPDEVTTSTDITYTFYSTGEQTVSALVSLTNNTQEQFSRSVTVINEPELPFPVELTSQPEYLLGPPPFGVLLEVETDEPLAEVLWDFGDGVTGEGNRIAHTYEKRGSFSAKAKVRSRSGSIAELSTLVRVAEQLNLPDLTFEGAQSRFVSDTIRGEVPLSLTLTPKTATPFVEFFWEASSATEVGSTEGTLQAIYRRQGIYNLVLVASNAEGKVLRKNFTVEVLPPASSVEFSLRPESGIAPLTVQFDASETFVPNEEITGYEWTFGDRSDTLFAGARTEHEYTSAGTYVVDLTVQTTSGKRFTAKKTIVVRPGALKACILASRTNGPAPLGVQFTSDCSSGQISSYLWDFGDSTQTDEKNPIHVFEESGNYTVTLTVEDAQSRVTKETVRITVLP